VSNEPQGEIVETKVSKAAKEKKPATEKRSAHPLSWINLVLMLVLIAIMGFAVWLGWQQQQSTTAEVAVLRDHLNTALQTLDQTSASRRVVGKIITAATRTSCTQHRSFG
jgi:uroporphyrin-3 C-methyltransferase